MEWLTTILGWINPFEWIKKGLAYIKRPKLILYFDEHETYHTRDVVGQGSLGFFCHVMVKNKGRSIAKKCGARLFEVSIRDNHGAFIPAKDFVAPVVLKWAHEPDFGPRDIEPNLPRRLDLCYILQSHPDRVIFFSPPIPLGVQTVFPQGVYRVKIRVDAEDTDSTESTFVIDHRGSWNEIRISE